MARVTGRSKCSFKGIAILGDELWHFFRKIFKLLWIVTEIVEFFARSFGETPLVEL